MNRAKSMLAIFLRAFFKIDRTIPFEAGQLYSIRKPRRTHGTLRKEGLR
jgi:hypothetical protein